MTSLETRAREFEVEIKRAEMQLLAALRAVAAEAREEALREAAQKALQVPETRWFDTNAELGAYCTGRREAFDAIRALLAEPPDA